MCRRTPLTPCVADLFGIDGVSSPTGRRLVPPIQIGVRNHLFRVGVPDSVLSSVVCAFYKCHVVASDKCAVEGRANAGVGLSPGNDEVPDPEFRQ